MHWNLSIMPFVFLAAFIPPCRHNYHTRWGGRLWEQTCSMRCYLQNDGQRLHFRVGRIFLFFLFLLLLLFLFFFFFFFFFFFCVPQLDL